MYTYVLFLELSYLERLVGFQGKYSPAIKDSPGGFHLQPHNPAKIQNIRSKEIIEIFLHFFHL